MLMVAWLALGAMGQEAPSGPCETLATALKGRVCVAAGPAGAAVATDEARARRLAELAGVADQGFRDRFGIAPAPYVVFDAGTPPEVSRDGAAFQRADFPVALPWFSGQAWIARQRRESANGIRAQMEGFGASEEQITNAVAQVTAGIEARNTPEALEARDAAGVPGDLTRQWFSRAYWPDAASGPTGTPAPGAGSGWLVEAAALLSEPESSAEARRALFREMYSGQGEGPLAAVMVDDLLDLRALVSTAAETPPTSGAGAPSPVRIIRNGGGGARPDLTRLTFAPRVRVFIDYLAARGGNLDAIRRIAEAHGRGETLDAWLASEGGAHGLAPTLDGLAADWRAWVVGTQAPVPG